MPVILLTNRYSENVLRVVKRELPEGFHFISLENATKEDLLIKATQADYFLASGRLSIDKDVIEAATKLKMIQRTGVGTDALDLQTLKVKGIPVYVNSGINSQSVAEHTVMLMLALLRKLPQVDKKMKSGIWKKNEIGIECQTLNNKVVGIIGMGNIGKNVVRMLQVFGVKMLYFDPNRLEYALEKELNIEFCDFETILKFSDILSLHCPLTANTKGLISEKEISLMKRGSFIINTGRGQLINEPALIHALQSEHLQGAGLDVFSKEPPDEKNLLLKLDNVILTPHVGGLTLETFSKMMSDAFKNISLFEQGKFDQIKSKMLL